MSQLVNAIHDLISDLPRPWRLHKLRALRLLAVRGARQDRARLSNEAQFFPLAAITPEQAALRLAVLHDAMCSCVTVSPWCDRPLVRAVRPVVTHDASYPAVLLDAEGPPLVSSGQTWNALRFAGLLNQVRDLAQNELWGDGPSLTAGQEQAIRDWLADVRVAIESIVSGWRGEAVLADVVAAGRDATGASSAGPPPPPTSDELRRIAREEVNSAILAATAQHDAQQSFDGFVPADTLRHDHGIGRNRLSEASKKGKVRSMRAPRGLKDSEGRSVRLLYHRDDAIKHCSPERRSGVPETETPPIPEAKEFSAPGR